MILIFLDVSLSNDLNKIRNVNFVAKKKLNIFFYFIYFFFYLIQQSISLNPQGLAKLEI